jgi:hypothetical protein
VVSHYPTLLTLDDLCVLYLVGDGVEGDEDLPLLSDVPGDQRLHRSCLLLLHNDSLHHWLALPLLLHLLHQGGDCRRVGNNSGSGVTNVDDGLVPPPLTVVILLFRVVSVIVGVIVVVVIVVGVIVAVLVIVLLGILLGRLPLLVWGRRGGERLNRFIIIIFCPGY